MSTMRARLFKVLENAHEFKQDSDDIKKLDGVMKQYEELYGSNISRLRHAIHPSEIWRFFVDGNRHQEGWLKFEDNEPGYLRAMTLAFQAIFLSHESPKKLASVLHKLATDQVNNLLYEENSFTNESRHSYRKTQNFRIPLSSDTLTSDGIDEAINEIIQSKNKDEFIVLKFHDYSRDGISFSGSLLANFNKPITKGETKCNQNQSNTVPQFCDLLNINLACLAPSREDAKLLLNCYLNKKNKEISISYQFTQYALVDAKICDAIASRMDKLESTYQRAIKEAKTPYEKLHAIASYTRDCERLHPFLDGNTRTFSMLLMNHLLIHNGFPIIFRNNPNHTYLITIKELVRNIINDMSSTLELVHSGFSDRMTRTTKFFNQVNKMQAFAFNQMIKIESAARDCIYENTAPISYTDDASMTTKIDTSKEHNNDSNKEAKIDHPNLDSRKKERDIKILAKMVKELEIISLFPNYIIPLILKFLSTDKAKKDFFTIFRDMELNSLSLASLKEIFQLLPDTEHFSFLQITIDEENIDQFKKDDIMFFYRNLTDNKNNFFEHLSNCNPPLSLASTIDEIRKDIKKSAFRP